MEKVSLSKVICGGGLNRKNNWIELSDYYPGHAVTLRNFEPSLYGGYRRLSGYQPLNEDNPVVGGSSAEGKILGVFIYDGKILAARKDTSGNTYSFYQHAEDGDWLKISTGYTPSSVELVKIRAITFNLDGTEKIIFVDGVNYPVCYDGTNWTTLTGDNILDRPRYISFFKNHIFISGDPDYPHLVAHSAPNDEEDWSSSGGSGQIIAGFDVVQLKPWRDNLIVFGLTKIKYIQAEGTTFTVKEMTENLGCISSDSVVETNGDLLFASQDGIRPISATVRNEDFELNSISKNIQDMFSLPYFKIHLENVNAVVIRKKSQVRFFLEEELLKEDESRGLLVGLSTSPEGQRWEWAELIGIKTSCSTSGFIIDEEYVLHGGFDGIVYRQEMGSSFAGRNIASMYATPYFDFGNPAMRKTMKSIKIFFRPEGPMNIYLGMGFDWGDKVNQNNILSGDYHFDIEGHTVVYNRAIYNQDYYSGLPVPYTFRNVVGSGFSHRLVFASEDTLPSYSIQSIIMEITTNGSE